MLLIIVISVVALGGFLYGCASQGPYRTLSPAPGKDQDLNRLTVENHDDLGYRVGYVEFDQQGWFWMPDRSQLSDVQQMVSESAQLGQGHKPRPIIMVAFVHGWKNNAEGGLEPPNANNVTEFKAELQDIAKSEKDSAKTCPVPRSPRPVVGVYLGWPGLSVNKDPLMELTFFSRKNVGDRVGLYGGVTEVLTRLNELSNSINSDLGNLVQNSEDRSYFVVVGHSFGAQVVYDSLSAIMTEELAGKRIDHYVRRVKSSSPEKVKLELAAAPRDAENAELVKPFGDLVVLVNPAFEAERYYNLKTLSERFPYDPRQRPVLAIFCSETDWATHYVFGVGRFFSTMFHGYRGDDLHDLQKRTDVQTIPWTDEFVTHWLVTQKEYTAGDAIPETSPWDGTTRVRPWSMGPCVLYPNSKNTGPWAPFYVARTSKAVMNGHDDIWNSTFQDFLIHFIGSITQDRKR
jgi:hypothetical protein